MTHPTRVPPGSQPEVALIRHGPRGSTPRFLIRRSTFRVWRPRSTSGLQPGEVHRQGGMGAPSDTDTDQGMMVGCRPRTLLESLPHIASRSEGCASPTGGPVPDCPWSCCTGAPAMAVSGPGSWRICPPSSRWWPGTPRAAVARRIRPRPSAWRTTPIASPTSSKPSAWAGRTCSATPSAAGWPWSCTDATRGSPEMLILAGAYAGWAGSLPTAEVQRRLQTALETVRRGPGPFTQARFAPANRLRLGGTFHRARGDHVRATSRRDPGDGGRLRGG